MGNECIRTASSADADLCLPHLREQSRKSLPPLLLPYAQFPRNVAAMIHRVVQRPMPKQHESQLVRCAHGLIVRVDRALVKVRGVAISGGRVETENLVVIYGVKFVVGRARDARRSVLVG